MYSILLYQSDHDTDVISLYQDMIIVSLYRVLSIFWWKIFRVEYFHDNITSSDVCPNYPKISLILRTESTTRVFSASGGVIMFITMVILCEKCTCLPKPITRYHCHNIILIFVNFSNQTKNGKLNFRSVLVLEKK